MVDSYLTISKKTEGFYKEKGSKFLGFAIPVNDITAVKEALDALRKEYYDGRHHCYAYILGNEGSETRANDDGEPNHSAGDPILGQIKSRNLTNTLVVVVRYFGGTKLGVSGLINAYKTAASEALDANKIVEKQITTRLKLEFPYEEMNEVMKLVSALDLNILNQDYHDKCIMNAEVVISRQEALENKIELLQKLSHDISVAINT